MSAINHYILADKVQNDRTNSFHDYSVVGTRGGGAGPPILNSKGGGAGFPNNKGEVHSFYVF